MDEVLENCSTGVSNCRAVCNQDDGETWECCSCSLVVPPPPQPSGPTQLVTVSDSFWRVISKGTVVVNLSL